MSGRRNEDRKRKRREQASRKVERESGVVKKCMCVCVCVCVCDKGSHIPQCKACFTIVILACDAMQLEVHVNAYWQHKNKKKVLFLQHNAMQCDTGPNNYPVYICVAGLSIWFYPCIFICISLRILNANLFDWLQTRSETNFSS